MVVGSVAQAVKWLVVVAVELPAFVVVVVSFLTYLVDSPGAGIVTPVFAWHWRQRVPAGVVVVAS